MLPDLAILVNTLRLNKCLQILLVSIIKSVVNIFQELFIGAISGEKKKLQMITRWYMALTVL